MSNSDQETLTPVQTEYLRVNGKTVRAERYTARQSEIPGAINWGWSASATGGLTPAEKADIEGQIAEIERLRRERSAS